MDFLFKVWEKQEEGKKRVFFFQKGSFGRPLTSSCEFCVESKELYLLTKTSILIFFSLKPSFRNIILTLHFTRDLFELSTQ